MEERFFIGGESKGGYGSRSSEGPVPARRSRRLISDTEFRNVQKMGKSRVDGLLVLRFRPNQEEFPRWGILVSRRVGGAVVRNKVKRKIRELVFPLSDLGGWDLVVVARPAAAAASFQALARSVGSLIRQAGLNSAQDLQRGVR